MQRSVFVLWIGICFVSANAFGYSGGIGTAEDPYQIATAQDLMDLGETPQDYGKHFVLTEDIDLDPNLPGLDVFGKAVIASASVLYGPGGPWMTGNAFKGCFDGQGHTIQGLQIQGRNCLGLFGWIGRDAIVANLNLEAVNIQGTGDYIGSLTGRSDGYVIACYCTGSVEGRYDVGGFVGFNDGALTSCCSNCTVRGQQIVGGFIGYHSSWGPLTSCHSCGSVSGDSFVGGLVGYNFYSTITSCYSTCLVNGSSKTGGLVGHNDGIIVSSFWDKGVSGITTSDGGAGLYTVDMQNAETYLSAGWDQVNETKNGSNNLWDIENGQYPRLAVFSGFIPIEPNGSGTLLEPYEITDINELGSIWYRPWAHYCLMSDIDLSGVKWLAAITPCLGGSLMGNGHIIRKLHVEGGGHLGLCGKISSPAIISNLGLQDVNIIGRDDYVGGLVGWNYGRILKCYSSGSVSANNWVGGLVGRSGDNYAGTTETIESCYSSGYVNGRDRVGGLIGSNSSDVSFCYSTNVVSGRFDMGGLMGKNYGSDSVNFWDVDVSGISKSQGGTGLSTFDMQTIDTFLDAGWDFTCETENGPNDIWTMLEGDYPRLTWELEEPPLCPVEAIELNATNFYETIAQGVVLVDFYATWCSHCRTQAPIVDEVATQVQDLATVTKLDIDQARSIMNAYGVNAIPTLILFKNGVEIKRFVGLTQAPVLVAAIQAAVQK